MASREVEQIAHDWQPWGPRRELMALPPFSDDWSGDRNEDENPRKYGIHEIRLRERRESRSCYSSMKPAENQSKKEKVHESLSLSCASVK